jgi:hypothetical protein
MRALPTGILTLGRHASPLDFSGGGKKPDAALSTDGV